MATEGDAASLLIDSIRASKRPVTLFDQSTEDEGRTVVDPHGTLVHFGVAASADRFHDAFLDVLNDRRPARARGESEP